MMNHRHPAASLSSSHDPLRSAYAPSSIANVIWTILLVGLVSLAVVPTCFSGSSAGDTSASGNVVPGKTLRGKATYYPDALNGHPTASGDTFHQSDHTAASNKLPLGTAVKITNRKTGKSTDVTVTDRGPALGRRKIDLSKKAAKDIGLTPKEGIAPVKIKVTATPGAEAVPVR
jgi:rare lipoprotein A